MANPFSLPTLIIVLTQLLCEYTSVVTSTRNNPLIGQHLRVIWPKWKGNPPGLAGATTAGDFLEYLSARFNFTYEMVRVTENTMEPSKNGRGFVDYLLEGQCDLLMADVVATNRRLAMVDFTLPWISDVVAFLIPVPDSQSNIDAVIKPFQWPVWLFIGISIICVIIVLNLLLQHYLQLKCPKIFNFDSETKQSKPMPPVQKKYRSHIRLKTFRNQYLYVFGSLLSQGGTCQEGRLSFRIVAGVWVLAAFVFVQAYQSTLFIYVIAPISSPLIDSVYDLAESKDINFIVRRGGRTFEYFFKKSKRVLESHQTLSWAIKPFYMDDSSNKTVYQKVQARIDASPRCNLTSDCIQMITPESRSVYADAKFYLNTYVEADFKRTGKCNLQVAREGLLIMSLSYALPKHSPYTNAISKGVLEIQELGLQQYWRVLNYPYFHHCSNKNGYKAPKTQPALSLKNLTGAFVVLVVGLSLSFFVFLYERMNYLFVTIKAKRDSENREREEKTHRVSLESEFSVEVFSDRN